MRGLRWGLALSVLGGVVLFAGCQSPIVVLKRGTYDKFQQTERLNHQQAALIAQLTTEKSMLAMENMDLKNQTGLYRAQLIRTQELIDALKNAAVKIDEAQGGVEGPENTTTFKNAYGVGIRMTGDLLFAPGQATLKPEAAKIMKEVADAVNAKPNQVAVWGFSDSDPIKVSGWKSNFELSGARALAVLDALKKEGVESARMHFAGWGEYDLMKGADGKEDKKRSRRVEVILLYQPASAPEMMPEKPLPPIVPK